VVEKVVGTIEDEVEGSVAAITATGGGGDGAASAEEYDSGGS
jgi:hypothetical protein